MHIIPFEFMRCLPLTFFLVLFFLQCLSQEISLGVNQRMFGHDLIDARADFCHALSLKVEQLASIVSIYLHNDPQIACFHPEPLKPEEAFYLESCMGWTLHPYCHPSCQLCIIDLRHLDSSNPNLLYPLLTSFRHFVWFRHVRTSAEAPPTCLESIGDFGLHRVTNQALTSLPAFFLEPIFLYVFNGSTWANHVPHYSGLHIGAVQSLFYDHQIHPDFHLAKMADDSSPYRLVIVTIFRNEAPYLKS